MARFLRIKNGSEFAARSEQIKYQTYDRDSGLAYTESIYQAAPMRADWVWKTRGSTSDIVHFKNKGLGCSSLLDMAIRKTCLHIPSLTLECLEGIGWQIGSLLWRRLIALYVDHSACQLLSYQFYQRDG